jgi:glutaredoxin
MHSDAGNHREPAGARAAGVQAADGPETSTAGPDGVVFFWRPGCGFCASLRHHLHREGLPLLEVDIWQDDRAAAAVRAITGGNETVPTVVVGPVQMVNPSPQQVLDAVTEHAPHLLPAT